MKKKLIIMISVLITSGVNSTNLLFADDLRINRKTSEKSYKLRELKTNLLNTKAKKIPVIVFRTESSFMSKGSATLIGAGIGFIGGAIIGAVVGSPGSPIDGGANLGTGSGILIGGLSGLALGGLIGLIFGG